jgi:phosphate-selective porin
MPFRLISVGGLVVFLTLALPAMRGAAAAASGAKQSARHDPTEADADAAPEVTPSVKVAPPPAPPVQAADAEAGGAPRPVDTVGFSDRLFIRSPGGEVIVFPGGRVQVDAAAFPRQTPKTGAYLRRARVELTGWLGRIFYFDVSAEAAASPPAASETLAPSVLPATDNYVAVAPYGDRFILQAGQFDAPFTLENRTSDAYTLFIERSMVARSVGAPRNKEVGAMAHGLLGDGLFYYSAGIFNGDGPDFRNLDNQPDVIGRLVVSPFSGGEGLFRRLAIGGSGWYGRHVFGPAFPVQATAGGVPFVLPQWTTGQPGSPNTQTLELRENGTVLAAAGELSLPFGNRFGLRGEFVYKQQDLAETEADTTGTVSAVGLPKLTAMAGYGELWFWVAGDERMLPAPGLQLPARIERRYRRAFEDGLVVALRGEFVKEDVINTATAVADPTRATTRVVTGTAGVNYWRGSFARISLNYIVNMWSGTSETIKSLRAQGQFEHEVLLRFATSL